MTYQYDGLHAITFHNTNGSNKKNTWKDFHLIPKKRYFIDIPEPKISIINIPGTSKRIDITEYLSKEMTFGEISGDWEFIIVHDLWNDWKQSYNSISDYFHGNDLIISLDDDPDNYYRGSITISDYNPDKEYSTIKLHYILNSKSILLPSGYYPIKFIYSDGSAYFRDYGVVDNNDLFEENTNIPIFYNLMPIIQTDN